MFQELLKKCILKFNYTDSSLVHICARDRLLSEYRRALYFTVSAILSVRLFQITVKIPRYSSLQDIRQSVLSDNSIPHL